VYGHSPLEDGSIRHRSRVEQLTKEAQDRHHSRNLLRGNRQLIGELRHDIRRGQNLLAVAHDLSNNSSLKSMRHCA
jgi:hypothetical protein